MSKYFIKSKDKENNYNIIDCDKPTFCVKCGAPESTGTIIDFVTGKCSFCLITEDSNKI